MPFEIVRQDITRMRVDAIVNAANETLLGGGGVDGCIHEAAGPELLDECRGLGGCSVGCAKVTGGYRLPARYVIHTVGPIWQGGDHGERALLESCYRESLKLAVELKLESVAFPLISAGAFGYPKKEALDVAVSTIRSFLEKQELTVYLVIFARETLQLSEKLCSSIRQFIDDRYVSEHSDRDTEQRRRFLNAHRRQPPAPAGLAMAEKAAPELAECGFAPRTSLYEALNKLDESFSQMLLRKIDEKGMTDVQCYKKANIDRKLFSKIRSDVKYKPSKPTAVALAIGLELDLDETKELLMKAGFALSHSSKFDIIVEYFISKGNYDIFEINEALFAFDQLLLGA